MTLKIATTTVALRTTNGTQDITISGFGTPKAALCIATVALTDGVAANDAALSVGFTDGTTHYHSDIRSENGSSSNTDVYNSSGTGILLRHTDNAGVQEMSVTFSAWITDGIRINVSDAPPSAYLITVTLFSGTDLTNAYVNQFSPSTTIDTAVDVTAPNFEPNVLILLRATGNCFSIGFVSNVGGVVNQTAQCYFDRDNVATSALQGYMDQGYGIVHNRNTGATFKGEFGSFDSQGFSCTTRNSATDTGTAVGYLALRITNFDANVGVITTPTSTGNQAITNPGFKPQFLMMLLTPAEADGTVYSDNRAGSYGVSVATADAQYSNSTASQDGVTTTNTESLCENQLAVLNNHDGSARWNATLVSFDTNGWTQNFSATHTTGALWGYLAIEAEVTASDQTIYPTGIASAEAIGTPALSAGGVSITPTGIASGEAFGTPTLIISQIIYPDPPDFLEEIGTPTLTPGNVNVAPTGIVSAEAFGTLALSFDNIDVPVNGIASAETFGSPTLRHHFKDGYGGNVNTACDVALNGSQEQTKVFNQGIHDSHEISPNQHGLYRFDLSKLPRGATVHEAKLHLFKNYNVGDGGGTITFHLYSIAQANSDWIEGTRNLAQALAGEPCWNAKKADGAGGIQEAWAGGANGCGISGTDYEATSLGSLVWTPVDDPYGTEYVFSLDTTRIAGWCGNNNTNYGLIGKTLTSGGDHVGQSDESDTTVRPYFEVLWSPPEGPVIPDGIPSAESFGSPTASPGNRNIEPTGLASDEQVGSIQISSQASLTLQGIASQETLGSPTLTPQDMAVTVTGIPTAESLGSPALSAGAAQILPDTIGSAESLGAVAIQPGAVTVSATGVPSDEALGAVQVTPGNVSLAPGSIASQEALGSPSLSAGGAVVYPSGLGSAETFGTPILVQGEGNIYPTGISSAEAIGTITIQAGAATLSLNGVASAEAFGQPSLSMQVVPSGLASSEAFGLPSLSSVSGVALTSIPSAEAIGDMSVVPGEVSLALSGISSEEQLGNPTLSSRIVVAPQSIPSAEQFGLPSIILSIVPAGIVSAESIGDVSIVQQINLDGIDNQSQIGQISIVQSVRPQGISSAEAFGSPVVSGSGVAVYLTGIPSEETVGSVGVSFNQFIVVNAITTGETIGTPSVYRLPTIDIDLEVSIMRDTSASLEIIRSAQITLEV